MSQIDTFRTGFNSIEQITDKYLNNKVNDTRKNSDISFEEILKFKQGAYETPGSTELKFSKHALNRLSDRDIDLSEEIKDRLESGVSKAKDKGINDSLVVVDSLAFIVNIPNKTVVTAMDQTSSEDSIFTNIDGAVFA